MFSYKDMSLLTKRKEFFANKLSREPVIYQCLEEYLINKTLINKPINLSQYDFNLLITDLCLNKKW